MMSNDRSTAARPADEFERIKAIVTSYRLVDTPAIIAAREYGYDIGLLKSCVAYALSYQAQPTPEGNAARAAYIRESHPGGALQDRRISPSAIAILRQLMANRIRFLVIGGVAAQLHGSSRVTHDLDILYDRSPDNVERLAALLMQWRSYLRGADPGLPFTPDADTIKNIEVLTLETEHGKFDVFQRVTGVGGYDDALKQIAPFRVADFAVLALSLEALISSKEAAGRPRDKAEVLELKTLRDIADQQQAAISGKDG